MVSQDSSTALRGLDVVPIEESNPTTLSPVSPDNKPEANRQVEAEVTDEVAEIEKLEERVEELEKQLEKQQLVQRQL